MEVTVPTFALNNIHFYSTPSALIMAKEARGAAT